MERRICKECGRTFVLTDGEIAFYERKGLSLPKRCRDCRQKGKENKSYTGNDERNSYIPNTYTSKKSRTPFIIVLCAVLAAVLVYAAAAGGFIADISSNALWQIVETESREVFERDTSVDVETDLLPSYTEDISSDTSWQTAEAETETFPSYTFRNSDLREEHFQKHGVEMGFSSAAAYEMAASAVVTNPDSLHKLEAEDGDDVYYLEATNEFVIVSTDGYIRTYFFPADGYAYFERQ